MLRFEFGHIGAFLIAQCQCFFLLNPGIVFGFHGLFMRAGRVGRCFFQCLIIGRRRQRGCGGGCFGSRLFFSGGFLFEFAVAALQCFFGIDEQAARLGHLAFAMGVTGLQFLQFVAGRFHVVFG
ncbi:hypothetical protein D7Y13_43775, partial [Corallococcus praedator]